MRFALKTAAVLAIFLSPLFQGVTGQKNTVTFSRNVSSSTGSAYFMSNDPSGNYLFAANIGQDAQLTLTKGYYTGGNGGHGIGPTPDALFSQGSIITAQNKGVVIAVNAGSDTLTAFRINPTQPTDLCMIGSPVYSGGQFPVSLAVNDAGTMVCALNGGAINGVSCFHLDSENGLTPIDGTTRSLNLPQSTPPTGPNGSVGHIVFRDNDTKLVVSVKGTLANPGQQNVLGFLATWDVNCDGSLSQSFTKAIGGVLPWSILDIPSTDALFVSDAGPGGYDIFNLAAVARNVTVQAQIVDIPKAIAICWSDYSNVTGNFYLDDFETQHIYEVNINEDLKGTIVKAHDLDPNDGPLDFKISHVLGKDRLYLLAGNNTALEAFDVNGPGQLVRIQKLDIGTPIVHAGLPLNPNNVFGFATYVVGQY